MTPLRRVLLAGAVAMSVGLTAVVVLEGFSPSFPMRLVEAVGIAVVATAAFAGVVVAVASHLANWREQSSEA